MRNSVFLSCPAILNAKQRSIFSAWHAALVRRDVEPRILVRTDYGLDPWVALQDHLRHVGGVAIFGFRQLEIRAGVFSGAEVERVLPLAVTSAWTQLEAGLAIAAGLPVLALAEPGIHEGVFDPTTWGYRIIGHELSNRPSDAVLDMFLMAISRKQHAPFVSSNGRSV